MSSGLHLNSQKCSPLHFSLRLFSSLVPSRPCSWRRTSGGLIQISCHEGVVRQTNNCCQECNYQTCSLLGCSIGCVSNLSKPSMHQSLVKGAASLSSTLTKTASDILHSHELKRTESFLFHTKIGIKSMWVFCTLMT